MKFLVVLALLGVVSAFKAAMPRARSTKLSVSFDTPTSRPYVDDPNEKVRSYAYMFILIHAYV
jgi:hypothetical protein